MNIYLVKNIEKRIIQITNVLRKNMKILYFNSGIVVLALFEKFNLQTTRTIMSKENSYWYCFGTKSF